VNETRKILLELFAVYGKGMTNNQLLVWEKKIRAAGITDDALRAACDSWGDTRDHAPSGVAPLLATIPKAQTRHQRGWWGLDGQWGGDWSKAPVADLEDIAARMLASGNWGESNAKSRSEFIAMTLSRGGTQRGIDESLMVLLSRQ
jgi:hypothetical protein